MVLLLSFRFYSIYLLPDNDMVCLYYESIYCFQLKFQLFTVLRKLFPVNNCEVVNNTSPFQGKEGQRRKYLRAWGIDTIFLKSTLIFLLQETGTPQHMPRLISECIWEKVKHILWCLGHPTEEKQTVIIGQLKNMFTRNDCMHQENILFFESESTGRAKSKCLHCAPDEKEQMVSFSGARNNFFAYRHEQHCTPPPNN